MARSKKKENVLKLRMQIIHSYDNVNAKHDSSSTCQTQVFAIESEPISSHLGQFKQYASGLDPFATDDP